MSKSGYFEKKIFQKVVISIYYHAVIASYNTFSMSHRLFHMFNILWIFYKMWISKLDNLAMDK